MSEWTKSTYCAADKPQCVEVQRLGTLMRVRDSKNPTAVLKFTADEWAAFVAGVKAGEFD